MTKFTDCLDVRRNGESRIHATFMLEQWIEAMFTETGRQRKTRERCPRIHEKSVLLRREWLVVLSAGEEFK